MASHNGAAFIGEQLNSIVPQLNRDSEIIVVDDDSDDTTCEIVEARLAEVDASVTIIKRTTCGGHQVAFAQAFARATARRSFLAIKTMSGQATA